MAARRLVLSCLLLCFCGVLLSGCGGAGLNNAAIPSPSGHTNPSPAPTPAGSADQPLILMAIIPDTIAKGESTILSWATENATSLSVDHGAGKFTDAEGSVTLAPATTTTYTLTATGPGGTATASLTVTVTP